MRSFPMRFTRRLLRNERGVAMIEFAIALPVLVLLGCTGIELANVVVTRMRVSQLALQIADNASRMGDAVQGVKTVSEGNITEVFLGGNLQSGNLNLRTNGRVILSSLEPVANPNSITNPQFKIQWQRCYGGQTHASAYGVQGATNLAGMGPTGRQVTAQNYNATMFVEVYYTYTPLFSSSFAPGTSLDEVAAMAVRDPRTLGVAPTASGTASGC